MFDWEEQQQWTVGDIIRKMREEAKIGLEQLSRGLCSVATLSRIEAGEREMDLLLAWRIFQRLGYKIDKYELLCHRSRVAAMGAENTDGNFGGNRRYKKSGILLLKTTGNSGEKERKKILCRGSS